MESIKNGGHSSQKYFGILARAFVVVGFLFTLSPMVHATSFDPGGGTYYAPNYTPLDSWTFFDSTNWTSDKGYAPISFTNLDYSQLGNGSSLVVDSTNAARLQYKVHETDGTTNLTVDSGTVMFWFAPSWSGTNQGGTGPGDWGRLFEVGGYAPDASFGWWSLYVDPAGANIYFSAQTNDLSGTFTNYLSAPIAWTTNYFHFVALTYSPTNTALYLDGGFVTNGPPLSVYPGANVLTKGFYIGSDSNGLSQAHGAFNSVATYSSPLDADTIQQMFSKEFIWYMMNPLNKAMFTLTSADSAPAYDSGYSAITGAGNLQWVKNATDCVEGTNALQVWLTNVTAAAASGGTMNVTFTIEGGLATYANYTFDVFATGYLQAPINNSVWVWLGQGQRCQTYTVNVNSANAFLILGTPQDSNGDGVTDAYSLLVAHIAADGVAQSDGFGVPYAWYVQHGLDPHSGSLDPDWDVLKNYQEYFYGTQPNISEGFSVWTTGGYISIP